MIVKIIFLADKVKYLIGWFLLLISSAWIHCKLKLTVIYVCFFISVYYVEKFIKEKVEKGKTFYLVKWLGYPEEDNTWEPEEKFDALLIQEFRDNKLNWFKYSNC